jgi:NADPH:quinone reductase-like Zn-dependent oxidoreductase
VDVGPLVIPHAQTAKLIEPGKRPLHDPPPPAQSTPVRGATHCEPRHDKEDLDIMRELMEAGKVTLVIDRLYRLNEVAEAVRYLAERHARGKVVITTIVGGIAL